MSSQVLTDAKVLVAGHDLSGQMNAVALEYAAEMKDATTFGQTTRINKGGLAAVTASMAGHWDSSATTAVDPVLFARVGTSDVPATIVPQGFTIGNTAYLFRAIAANYQLGDAVGEILPFSVEMEGAGGHPLVRGQLFHSGSATGNVTGTVVQLGAIGATQYIYAALHVMSGSGEFTVKVQSDNTVGFADPTDRITFTVVPTGTAVASEWTRLAGAQADDYWRIVATNPATRDFVVALGIK